ncbi:MAG: hypothetical protein NVS4B3_20780 [Gemmatimonadaceae bacterium]
MNPYRAYVSLVVALVVALGAAAWMLDVPLGGIVAAVVIALGVGGWVGTNRAQRAVPPPPRGEAAPSPVQEPGERLPPPRQ